VKSGWSALNHTAIGAEGTFRPPILRCGGIPFAQIVPRRTFLIRPINPVREEAIMRYSLDRYHLQLEIETKECDIPDDQRARIQDDIDQVGEAVQDFPTSELKLLAVRHPRSDRFHVEARLKLPGKTLFTGQWDPHLDAALTGCLQKLVHKVRDYRTHPNREGKRRAEDLAAQDQELIVPTDADAGELGEAVAAGDYSRFRELLADYEDWLRNRVGRWVQRFPEADERIGESVPIADVVEEVYLQAFTHYGERPDEIPFSKWLDDLVDPSLRTIYRNWDEERENVSFARTLRETLPGR
jgi:ribosome-associated translation inhibitor RaiA